MVDVYFLLFSCFLCFLVFLFFLSRFWTVYRVCGRGRRSPLSTLMTINKVCSCAPVFIVVSAPAGAGAITKCWIWTKNQMWGFLPMQGQRYNYNDQAEIWREKGTPKIHYCMLNFALTSEGDGPQNKNGQISISCPAAGAIYHARNHCEIWREDHATLQVHCVSNFTPRVRIWEPSSKCSQFGRMCGLWRRRNLTQGL